MRERNNMARGLLCFDCFKKFKPHGVWFRCQNSSQDCRIELDIKLKEVNKHAFPLYRIGSKLASWWKAPLQANCDLCGFSSKERLCPHCHWKLLPGHGQLAEHIIAVVGNCGAGQSHYYPVLIESILKGKVGDGFQTTVQVADNKTEKRYEEEYLYSLYRLKCSIPSTSTKTREHRRLSFIIEIPKLKRKLTVVFYDVAGELLARVGDDNDWGVIFATSYLWNSSGILYLVNPCDVDEWVPFLDREVPAAYPPDMLFARILRELRKHKEIPERRKVPVPLAVCISQFDRFYDKRCDARLSDELFNSASSPVQNGQIVHDKLEKESNTIREFMLNTGGSVRNLVHLMMYPEN